MSFNGIRNWLILVSLVWIQINQTSELSFEGDWGGGGGWSCQSWNGLLWKSKGAEAEAVGEDSRGISIAVAAEKHHREGLCG